ncbi:MAG: hypothetical protein JRJ59_09325, partial [Deltaproteobacteria bacterium]|nr:hypothetical protein [Deltaproteobacteria bacterium]
MELNSLQNRTAGQEKPPGPPPGGLFLDFFYLLRRLKIPVSITEWLTLMEALDQGHALSSLNVFYYL